MQILYLIDKNDLKYFRLNEAIMASIDMQGTEFVRNYDFKLHKKMIIEQLNCYFETKVKKK